VQLACERLEDKTSLVRKEAIRLLAKFIETHPFWLDGGSLDADLFQKNLAAIQEHLEVMRSCTC
jgi:condensin complex subunit 1